MGTVTPTGRGVGFRATVQSRADTGAGTATLSDDRQPPMTYAIEVSE